MQEWRRRLGSGIATSPQHTSHGAAMVATALQRSRTGGKGDEPASSRRKNQRNRGEGNLPNFRTKVLFNWKGISKRKKVERERKTRAEETRPGAALAAGMLGEKTADCLEKRDIERKGEG